LKYLKSLSIISIVIVIAVLFVSCEKTDDSVIDPELHFPKILGASISPNVYDTSDINGIAWAKVISDEPVQKVTVTVKNPLGEQVGVFELKDDGNLPDTTEGDGKYVGRMIFSMPSCRLVGNNYQGGFVAQNISGVSSGLNNVSFSVINSHSVKPVLSNLIAPDSIQRPVTGQTIIFLEIQVNDPDGLCDIERTYFNSFRPDSTPSPYNPFQMWDDGAQEHCDATAGDGKYSLCVAIDSLAHLGYYTFKFNAKDRSEIVSDTLLHLIKVYP
jgi:hypothetical protein